MSCLGPNYNPIPTREWYRFENVCVHNNNNNKNNSVIWNGKFYPLSNLKKGNVLQYKKNSANITKQQRYAQIVKGKWTNRTKTWGTQTVTYTNPNIASLKRICYNKIITNNGNETNASSCINSYQPTDLPLTCDKYIKPSFHSLPINKNVSSKTNQNMPFNKNNKQINNINYSNVLPKTIVTSNHATKTKTQNEVIPNGGILLYNISENICTGQIYSITEPQTCFPSTDSNIPGPPVYLCYNSNLPTYYPRQRVSFSAGGNKWPEGEKAFFYTNDENAQNCEI
uniref:Uncharacterized protein n=1 Tax=viral metagenome TaxID=1070528 RepID=A0A6C0D9L8_9ZZZZ